MATFDSCLFNKNNTIKLIIFNDVSNTFLVFGFVAESHTEYKVF